jgi:hypothetical protein
MSVYGLQALLDLHPKNIPQRLKPVRFSRHDTARLKPSPFKTVPVDN